VSTLLNCSNAAVMQTQHTAPKANPVHTALFDSVSDMHISSDCCILLHRALHRMPHTGSHCCVRSGWHSIAVWFAQIFHFRFSFAIVLVLVRSVSCNFYSYIVFVSQIVIVLVFVLIKRSAIILVFVFVFVTKIALKYS